MFYVKNDKYQYSGWFRGGELRFWIRKIPSFNSNILLLSIDVEILVALEKDVPKYALLCHYAAFPLCHIRLWMNAVKPKPNSIFRLIATMWLRSLQHSVLTPWEHSTLFNHVVISIKLQGKPNRKFMFPSGSNEP